MKRIFLILALALTFSFEVPALAIAYDQSSPVNTAKSLIIALMIGDSKALTTLTKDVIPWSYFESDLLEYATENMSDVSLYDYFYHPSENNSILIYNKTTFPSPEINDYFCLDFVRADGKYYINELHLPGHMRGVYSYVWEQRCIEAQNSVGFSFKEYNTSTNEAPFLEDIADFELNGTTITRYTGNASKVIIPDGITRIDDFAFEQCSSIIDVIIPNSVTTIGNYAFAQCSSLTNIIIPDSITSIGEFAFNYCQSLKSIQLEHTSTSLANSVFFKCTSLEEVTLPSTLESIEESLFYGCTALTNVTIPNSVTQIKGSAFEGCSSLENLKIPQSVIHIENGALQSGFGLTLQVVSKSKAENYALNNGIEFEYYTPSSNEHPPIFASSPRQPTQPQAKLPTVVYNQSSPLATAKSFIDALLNGDSKALNTLTKDIIPWSYFESDLLEHSTDIMTGSSTNDFRYFQSDGNAIILYDARVTPVPEVHDFYCMDFVKADGKYYINDLCLPNSLRSYHWEKRCENILQSKEDSQNAHSTSSSAPTTPTWQYVWTNIDKKMQLIDIYLDPDPQYLFEAFVEEYQNHPYTRAWTAALSTGDIVCEFPSAFLKSNAQALCDLFNSDAKVADLVIQYLASINFVDKYASLENAEQEMKHFQTTNGIYSIEGELNLLDNLIIQIDYILDGITFENVSDLVVFSKKSGKQFKLKELLSITHENYKDIYQNLIAIRKFDGIVDLSDSQVISNVFIDTPNKLGDNVKKIVKEKILQEHETDSFQIITPGSSAAKILQGAELFDYIIAPVLSGAEAYVEFKKYESVLSACEEELQYILECSKSESVDRITNKVMDILTDTVSEGIALSIQKKVFTDTLVKTGEIVFDVSAIPLAVVKVEAAILQLAADTSNTFSKVWAIEDLYDEFKITESNLLQAIRTFHSNPTNATYHDLRATYQYYSILVKSGSKAVSEVLINDAEANVNKFKNWLGMVLNSSNTDNRLEQLEYAKSIPIEDMKKLDALTQMLFTI